MGALVLVALVALGPVGPRGGASPCGLLRQEAEGLVDSYPPCFEVTLEAEVSGRPPLEVVWELPGGGLLQGNPVVLDTGLLPAGFSEIELTVSNAAGSASRPVAIAVESLAFPRPPSFAGVEGTTVAARAETTGATEWRWTWGDGTGTGWLSGCEGYAPTHTYPAPGTYQVRVEARSCREGPLVAVGTVEVGGGTAPLIERFQAVCPTEPFCSFGVGEAVAFDTVVSGPVDAFLYDWNGDGFDDDATPVPLASHVYQAAGAYVPRLTVVSGTQVDVRHHAAPIEVVGGGTVLFADGFESGDLSRWTLP